MARLLSLAHFNREKQFTTALDIDTADTGAFVTIRKADKSKSTIALNPAEMGHVAAVLLSHSAKLTAERAEADFQAYKAKGAGDRKPFGVEGEEPDF